MLHNKAKAAETIWHLSTVHTVDTHDLLVVLERDHGVLLRGVVRVILRNDIVVLVLEADRVDETLLAVVARERGDLLDVLRLKLDRLLVAVLLVRVLEEGRLGAVAHMALHGADVNLLLTTLEGQLGEGLVRICGVERRRPVETHVVDLGILPAENGKLPELILVHICRLLVDGESGDELGLTSRHDRLDVLLQDLSSADDLSLVLLPVLEVAGEEVCKLLALKLETLLVLLGRVGEESELVLLSAHVGVNLFIEMLKSVVHLFDLGCDVVPKLLDLHDLLLCDA